MTFKRHYDAISYVRFTLSDGTTSPEIQTPEGRKDNEKTLTFEANAAQNISSVKGFGNDVNVCDLHFFNANGETVAFYDPGSQINRADRVHKEWTLAENERIIGFYGAFNGNKRYFSNLGLLVRVQS